MNAIKVSRPAVRGPREGPGGERPRPPHPGGGSPDTHRCGRRSPTPWPWRCAALPRLPPCAARRRPFYAGPLTPPWHYLVSEGGAGG